MSAEPDSGTGVNIWISDWGIAVNQTAAERRAGCLAKAQSAEGCRSKTTDEDIRSAYAHLAKSWADLADRIATMGEKQPN